MDNPKASITIGFFSTSELYPNAFDDLLLKVTRNENQKVTCRVKAGLLLLEPSRISEVRYGPATEHGRELTSFSEETSYLLERQRLQDLFRSLHFTFQREHFGAEYAIRTHCELITFSSVLPEILEDAATESGLGSALHAIAIGPGSQYDVYKTFWRSLLWQYIVVENQVLEMHEYAPIELDFCGSYEYLVDIERTDADDTKSTWGYFTSFDNESLIVEDRFSALILPPDLPQPPKQAATPRQQAPTESVLAKIPGRITKRHKQDDETAPAFGRLLDDPISQWPDPDQVLNKLAGYSLKRGHPDNKWIGFATIGYYAARPGDLPFLSYALCSGLCESEFAPFDIRVTSNGTLQFATDILLPLRWGGYHAIRTAWHAKDGEPLSLSSAYLASSGAGAHVAKPPASVMEEDDWETLYEWLTTRSINYGSQTALSMQQGLGLLWLPHSDERTRSFASWYRRKVGGTGRVFNRKRFGGRCTLLSLDLHITSMTQVVGTYRMAQICLGISGVRSRPEFRLD